MPNRSQIKDSIIAKLKTLSTIDSDKIKEFESAKETGYPFCTCVCIGSQAEQEDEVNIMRTYLYRIRIVVDQNKTQGGGKWTEEAIEGATTEVINSFDQDYTLGDTVQNIVAISDKMLYDITESGIMRISEIVLEVKFLHNINL